MRTIYCNGKINTMNKNNDHASAIVEEDGKIIYVGNDKEALCLKEDDSIIIDLHKNHMLPGFIDGHSHFVGLANSLSQCDLSKATCFNDIVVLMKTFIENENIPSDQWVYGCNYDHNFLEEKEHPTADLLDKISTTQPVVIVHASSHMGVANHKALEEGGIHNDSVDPEGGKYGRTNGILNGYLEENAFINFQNKAPMISVERLFQLMVKAQDIYASYGITTIQEGMVASELWQLLQYASMQNLLKLDVVAYIDLLYSRDLFLNNQNYLSKYINHLKIGGNKIFLDGSPQGRTAFMTEPYEGSDDYCGNPILPDEKVIELYKIAKEDKQQLLAHCNGDGACEQFLKAAEVVEDGYRPVMVHAQLVRKHQLERMAKTNMMPSFFVAHTYYWGDIHIENFGYERAKNICPVNTATKLNIPYTFHQDSPVLMPNMIETVKCAMHRKTRNGVLLNQEECIDLNNALKAITINGAYQYYEEDSKGSIEVGKKADLVILNNQGDVLETIKEGKTIFRQI